jgi:membrane-associated phospholipid phosphatase
MLNKFIHVNLETKNRMNKNVIDNYTKLKPSLFFLPIFFLITIVLFLYSQHALSVDKYIQIQKSYFYFFNSTLSKFPNIIYNLTQLGDALVSLSLLTILIVYAPKIWEALLSASILSAIFSGVLKEMFLIPRPAAAFDNNSFVIIGETLPGYSSLPSGHSITIFTTLIVLLFAFMPQSLYRKILWFFLILIAGLMVVFTRVGVGAHYPLDVIVGSIVGYISALIGIFISQKYKIWTWINNKKYYPIFMLLFLICCVALINKIMNGNLIIFYLALISLLVSLYKIIYVYFKK